MLTTILTTVELHSLAFADIQSTTEVPVVSDSAHEYACSNTERAEPALWRTARCHGNSDALTGEAGASPASFFVGVKVFFGVWRRGGGGGGGFRGEGKNWWGYWGCGRWGA